MRAVAPSRQEAVALLNPRNFAQVALDKPKSVLERKGEAEKRNRKSWKTGPKNQPTAYTWSKDSKRSLSEKRVPNQG